MKRDSARKREKGLITALYQGASQMGFISRALRAVKVREHKMQSSNDAHLRHYTTHYTFINDCLGAVFENIIIFCSQIETLRCISYHPVK